MPIPARRKAGTLPAWHGLPTHRGANGCAMPSKLSLLKNWLTLTDSAKYLTRALGEDVSVADLLHLALQQKLTLSISLVTGHFGATGKQISMEDAELCRFSIKNERPDRVIETITGAKKQAYLKYLSGERLTNNAYGVINRPKEDAAVQFKGNVLHDYSGVLEFDEDDIQYVYGLWDLTMMGAEALDIEDDFYRHIGGPDVILSTNSGVILSHPEIDSWLKLYHSEPYASNDLNAEDFIPADRLPEQEPIVIRRDELQRFADSLNKLATRNTDSDRQEYPPDLDILVTAWKKWWKNVDRRDRSSYPAKVTVKNWLMEQGLSDKTADAGATIITPEWKKTNWGKF